MTADPRGHGAALDLVNLTKTYGSFAAAREITLSIEAGEFVTFLGPSGSGKTTTLNMIAGFIQPTEGEIHLAGRPIANLPPHRRDIGMVFQHYALFPHMTVAQNIAFPLRQRRVPRAEVRRRVDEALAMVRLEGLGDRHPRQLSGGQQQRVALARAVVFSPQVLLMDEPLGALDKKLREWLQLEIKRVHRELGITFIYVTHDQEEALVLSDRIAVFNDGRIDQVGTATDLYERPRTLFAAEFLGESTLFHGRIQRGGDGTYLDGALGRIVVEASTLPDGTPAVVVVRPERLRIVHPGGAPGVNLIDAVVSQVIYLGSSRRLQLELPDGRAATVREPAGSLSPAQEGDRTQITWDLENGIVLPVDDAPQTQEVAEGVPAVAAR